jgi:hypothetical protein
VLIALIGTPLCVWFIAALFSLLLSSIECAETRARPHEVRLDRLGDELTPEMICSWYEWFKYVLGNLLGISSPLTTVKPQKGIGEYLDLLVSTWSLVLTGLFVGIIGGLSMVRTFVERIDVLAERRKKKMGMVVEGLVGEGGGGGGTTLPLLCHGGGGNSGREGGGGVAREGDALEAVLRAIEALSARQAVLEREVCGWMEREARKAADEAKPRAAAEEAAVAARKAKADAEKAAAERIAAAEAKATDAEAEAQVAALTAASAEASSSSAPSAAEAELQEKLTVADAAVEKFRKAARHWKDKYDAAIKGPSAASS